MEVKFNVTGERRKEMVGVISGIVGMRPVYMRVPTCNYVIGSFTVTKDGTLVFDNRSESGLVEKVLDGLAQAGFESEQPAAAAAETADTAQVTEAADNPAEEENAPQGENLGLTVEIPLDAVRVGNLTKILEAKGGLIKKALGVDDLRFEIKDDRIAFPWFAEVEPDEAAAYTHFISALCEMAKNQKRITAKEKETDNDKYAFRCFLLRLGFIGAEFKTERKVLLKNLSGSSAFKSGKAKTAEGGDVMTTEAYMREWGEICAAYCKRENAELLFVNTDSFGAQFPDGTLKHIYADELGQILKGGAKK